MANRMSHSGHSASRRALKTVFGLTASFTAVEFIGGLLTGSLALLADAGHMLSDVASLGLALVAAWLAERPPTPQRSFGYRRAEVLAALVNGVLLIAIALWIFVEAYRRLHAPPAILGGWMLAVAVVGLLVNILGAEILRRSEHENINVHAALRHVLADLLGSVGAIAAAGIILVTGWRYADPLISVFIGILVLASSWHVLRVSVNILLEATPEGIDAGRVGDRIRKWPGIEDVRDLHIWTITSGFPALSAHLLVGRDEDCHARRREVQELLAKEFGIDHTTLQADHMTGKGTQ